ncbi:MAG: glycosyltransferase family 4 protein [Solirubrobacteraceae bacterium]
MGSRVDSLIVFREADPASGGLGIDIADVAQGLSARGHRVEVMAMRSPDGSAGDLGPDVVMHGLEPWLRTRAGVAFGLAGGTRRVVRARTPRVLHVYSCLPVHMHWTAALAAHRARVPVVWTPMLHPARTALWRNHGLAGRAMTLWDACAPRAARWADAVCAATRAEAQLFAGMGARRVALVPPAVHPAARVSASEAQALRERLGLRDAPLVLCVAGRPDRRKGLDYAAAVVTALRDRVPNAVLGTVGLGDNVPLARVDGVRALGRLSLRDLRRAYRAADVVFVPSRYEAFSRVVVEGWQQARPVVVSDRVALAEEVQHGGGAVVPFGDVEAGAAALEHYLRDRDEAQRAGEYGAELVSERYLVGSALDRLERVYAEVAR